jgi:hypothetical protein
MKSIDKASRLINGTFGELWLDGEKIAECTACQAKLSKNKEDINLCGDIVVDSKLMSIKGTGSLTLYHVDSGFLQREPDLKSGVDRRFTIVSKLKDPDAMGAERIAIYNVSFDDMTLTDWAAAKNGQITKPFTFTRYELLDQIQPV